MGGLEKDQSQALFAILRGMRSIDLLIIDHLHTQAVAVKLQLRLDIPHD